MDEVTWLSCADPTLLLENLPVEAGPRKLRLFACACCREVLRLRPSEQGLAGVIVAERLADEEATEEEQAAAAVAVEVMVYEASQDAAGALGDYHGEAGSPCGCPYCEAAAESRWREINPDADGEFGYRALEASLAAEVAGLVGEAVCFALEPTSAWREAVAAAGAAARQLGQPIDRRLVRLLHDLFGNPFRPVSVDPTWLTPDVRRLAVALYEEGAFDRLPILGDALEEAGCTDRAVLGHCRGPGPHLRGCHVLDALLGKD
jgi:hypothetical protein